MNRSGPALVSVVLSFRNEAENIPTLVSRLEAMFAHHDVQYELLFVNDASTDASLAALLYERERNLVDAGYVIPLVYIPESVGLAATVRDWMPSRWGEWRLADVWLDLPNAPPKNDSSGAALALNAALTGARP